MRGVIYARYSSDNQREESIEGQIRENTAHANKNGIDIVGTYIDRAYSAKTDNHPEFQRMIKDSAKKGFDVVIVWKLDRFSRNRYDSAKYKAMLRKNDVSASFVALLYRIEPLAAQRRFACALQHSGKALCSAHAGVQIPDGGFQIIYSEGHLPPSRMSPVT